MDKLKLIWALARLLPGDFNAWLRNLALKWLKLPPVPSKCDVKCPVCFMEYQQVPVPPGIWHASMKCCCGAELDIRHEARWCVVLRKIS